MKSEQCHRNLCGRRGRIGWTTVWTAYWTTATTTAVAATADDLQRPAWNGQRPRPSRPYRSPLSKKHGPSSSSSSSSFLPPWGMSSTSSMPLPVTSRTFLDECQSLVQLLEGLPRGGGDRDEDDYYYEEDRNGYYHERRNDNHYPQDYGDYYDDRGPSPRSSPSPSSTSSSFNMDRLPSIIRTGDRRIGLSLVGAGSVVTMLGMSLFFNKALLRLGNLLFIAGVAITMGLSRTASFFLQPEKLRATLCLGIGIVLVFLGSPVFGMMLEIFGLLNLFGNMFPVLLAVAKTLPGIGPLLNNLTTNNNSNNKNSKSRDRTRNRFDDNNDNRYYEKDNRYDDDYYYQDDDNNNNDYYNDGYGGQGRQGYY